MRLADFDNLPDDERDRIWRERSQSHAFAVSCNGAAPRGWQEFDEHRSVALQLEVRKCLVWLAFSGAAVVVDGVTVSELRLAAGWTPPEEGEVDP